MDPPLEISGREREISAMEQEKEGLEVQLEVEDDVFFISGLAC
jgi:hypothetical protein